MKMSDINKYLLLTLLIHRRTKEKYYKDFEDFKRTDFEKLKKGLWLHIDEIPDDFLKRIEQSYFWPPWRFNDIAGFVEIKLENPWTIVADIYKYRGRYSKKKPFLYYPVYASKNFEPNNDSSLKIAIKKLVRLTQSRFETKRWKIEFDELYSDNIDYFSILKNRGVETADTRKYIKYQI